MFLYWLLFALLAAIIIAYKTNAKVRYYGRFIIFGLITLSGVLVIPVLLFRPGDACNIRLLAFFLGPLLSFFLGNKFHLRGEENLVEGASIIVANHQSCLDFHGMLSIWLQMDRCAPIVKKQFLYLGPLGLLSWLCGCVFIERTDPKSSHEALKQAGDIAKGTKLKLWIFPEGTRSMAEDMLPFKKGAFHLAITTQLPITPVVFSRYHFLDNKEKRFDPGHTIITVLPPISTQNMTLDDMPRLMEDVRSKMTAVFRSTSEELDTTC